MKLIDGIFVHTAFLRSGKHSTISPNPVVQNPDGPPSLSNMLSLLELLLDSLPVGDPLPSVHVEPLVSIV